MRGSVGKSHLSLPGRLPSLATIKHHCHRRHSQCHHHHRHHLWFSNMSSHCITLQANLVTLDCQVIKIVMTSGSGQNCNQRASRDYSFLSSQISYSGTLCDFCHSVWLERAQLLLIDFRSQARSCFYMSLASREKEKLQHMEEVLALDGQEQSKSRVTLSSELWNWNWVELTHFLHVDQLRMIMSHRAWKSKVQTLQYDKRPKLKLSEPISSSQCLFTQHDTLPLSYVEALFKRGNGDL